MQEELIIVLKELKKQLIIQNFQIKEINQDYLNAKQWIKQAILFDNDSSCYNGKIDLNYAVIVLLNTCINYGMFYNNELIGIHSIGNCDYIKDKNIKTISGIIKKEYRGIGIGSYFLESVIKDYQTKYKFNSIHTAARIDNIASQKTLEKNQFKQYPGYKEDNYFIDESNNHIPQIQYTFKRQV